jgi:hypothetical protein
MNGIALSIVSRAETPFLYKPRRISIKDRRSVKCLHLIRFVGPQNTWHSSPDIYELFEWSRHRRPVE